MHQFVAAFMKVRFPTVYVLNKIDSPQADANISRICEKYNEVRVKLATYLHIAKLNR